MGLAAIARAGGMDRARRPRAAARPAPAQVRAYFAEVGRRRGEIPGARRTARASARSPSTAGTPTSTKARSTAGWRRCSARSTAPSRRSRPTWATAWRETVGRGRHRVRPHRAHQRHRGHRPRHRARSRCSPAARSRAAASSPTGRASRTPTCTRTATSSRPPTCAPCSRACCKDHLRVDERALAAQRVPRQRRGEADGGAAGVTRVRMQCRRCASAVGRCAMAQGWTCGQPSGRAPAAHITCVATRHGARSGTEAGLTSADTLPVRLHLGLDLGEAPSR